MNDCICMYIWMYIHVYVNFSVVTYLFNFSVRCDPLQKWRLRSLMTKVDNNFTVKTGYNMFSFWNILKIDTPIAYPWGWAMGCLLWDQSMIYIRADSRLSPSQWETSLQSYAISHWLGANLESALYIQPKQSQYQTQSKNTFSFCETFMIDTP